MIWPRTLDFGPGPAGLWPGIPGSRCLRDHDILRLRDSPRHRPDHIHVHSSAHYTHSRLPQQPGTGGRRFWRSPSLSLSHRPGLFALGSATRMRGLGAAMQWNTPQKSPPLCPCLGVFNSIPPAATADAAGSHCSRSRSPRRRYCCCYRRARQLVTVNPRTSSPSLSLLRLNNTWTCGCGWHLPPVRSILRSLHHPDYGVQYRVLPISLPEHAADFFFPS